jgi:ubiquinone/menaquinone biosynthesis C-methylase UbiE
MRQRKAKKILEHVKKTYDTIADDFDMTRSKAGGEFEIFEPLLKPGDNIIDIGCGNGRLLWFLQKAAKKWPEPKFHYLGIDNSEKILELAKKHFPKNQFKGGDMLKLPAEDDISDIIFCIRAFHHLASKKQRVRTLEEMRRVLQNNGKLIITVWNLWQIKYLKYIFRGFLRFIYSFGGYAVSDTFIPWGKKAKRYYHAFTPYELNKIVSSAGFEIEDVFYVKDGHRVPFKESHDIVLVAKKVIPPNAG